MKQIISRSSSLLFWTVFFCALCMCAQATDMVLQSLFINDVEVLVEIADTVEKRVAGLQNRLLLDHDNGMFFIYDEPQYLNFWMKDTAIPLDLAYIDQDGVIVEIYSMYPHDHTVKRSREKVRYVLEVNQGWFADKGIKPGDRIQNIDDFTYEKNILKKQK